ncbi:hypothetical protein RchiOBHm_Chr5g0061871 [Rosa chinensis]|uniref:Uncharacterized protein n=1 Tax=Rosa chinensis TaxID=74649 RepID=A0A2P6QI24_ROSCH|nr:hypothetical protein RchiOBHm_Chr5g0061871 [Rosa chinensis]
MIDDLVGGLWLIIIIFIGYLEFIQLFHMLFIQLCFLFLPVPKCKAAVLRGALF